MAASRATRLRSEKFDENVTKRGKVTGQKAVDKRDNGYTVNPILLGFFFFVLVGSSVFQIIRNVQLGPIF